MKKQENEGFFLRVYRVAVRIPPGRVTSYGAIASFLGSPGAARMVGWAMNQCDTYPEYIPAHRVVNRQGLLTGKHHFQGANLMKELLENEGLTISENRIVDFEKYFWDPAHEIDLEP